MKIYYLILSFSLACITTHGQLATIYDSDGYTNVRRSASAKSAIIGRVKEGQIFSISPLDDETGSRDWYNVWFQRKPVMKKAGYLKSEQVTLSGYMHKTRITALNQLPQVQPFEASADKLIFRDASLEITFEVKPSAPSRGGQMEMNKISISSPSGIYNLPADALAGLSDIHIEQVRVYKGRKKEIFITAAGADGSDGYEVAWCIKNNRVFTMTVMQTIP